MTEPRAWLQEHERGESVISLKPLPRGADELGWTETPLYGPEALAERDGRIAELTDRLGAMLSTTDVLMVRESVMPGFRDARINALAALKGRTDDHTG